MNIEEYNYNLPEELIAQTPLLNRDQSKLLVLDKNNGGISHRSFFDVIDYLEKGDTLVLNNTKVLPARLFGVKEDTNAMIEILLLKNIENDTWECLVKNAKKVKIGTVISFGEGKIKAECLAIGEEGIRTFNFIYKGIFLEQLEDLGIMPLPPYIKEQLSEQDRYQTVYAKEMGSAAAPTAGLHFTKELMNKIKDKGINITYVTLHVGLGTFRPVSVDDINDHKMHSEYYELTSEVANTLNNTRLNNKKIIAVGTTTTRVLETIIKENDSFAEKRGWTDIFIYPPYKMKSIDGLITNFHLPKSTLLMLVSTIGGYENIKSAYQEAIKQEYRFFSFGDAMLII